jgi:hypothetical protein
MIAIANNKIFCPIVDRVEDKLPRLIRAVYATIPLVFVIRSPLITGNSIFQSLRTPLPLLIAIKLNRFLSLVPNPPALAPSPQPCKYLEDFADEKSRFWCHGFSNHYTAAS